MASREGLAGSDCYWGLRLDENGGIKVNKLRSSRLLAYWDENME